MSEEQIEQAKRAAGEGSPSTYYLATAKQRARAFQKRNDYRQALAGCNNPNSVKNTRNITQHRQEYVHPKLKPDTHLKENSKRRDEDRKNDS